MFRTEGAGKKMPSSWSTMLLCRGEYFQFHLVPHPDAKTSLQLLKLYHMGRDSKMESCRVTMKVTGGSMPGYTSWTGEPSDFRQPQRTSNALTLNALDLFDAAKDKIYFSVHFKFSFL
jgi:hypothetical protein